MESKYRVEADAFFGWFTQYLKELSKNRKLSPNQELGLASDPNVLDSRRYVGNYCPVAVRFPASPAPVWIVDLKPRDFPRGRGYSFLVRYAAQRAGRTASMDKDLFAVRVEPGADLLDVTFVFENEGLTELFRELNEAVEWHFPGCRVEQSQPATAAQTRQDKKPKGQTLETARTPNSSFDALQEQEKLEAQKETAKQLARVATILEEQKGPPLYSVEERRGNAPQEQEESPIAERETPSPGRKTLLCNLWAFGESKLGRQPDIEEWKRLYTWETGKELPIDPATSMKKAIDSLRKKYRK